MGIEAPEALDSYGGHAALAAAEPEERAEPYPPPVELIRYRPPLHRALAETWRQRHALRPLMLYFLRRRLRRVRLGPTWLVLNALMAAVGYAVIFGGGVFNVEAPGGMPYVLFMIVGMMGWRLFNMTVNLGMRSVSYVRRLNEDLNVPILLIPIAGSAVPLFDFLVYMCAYVAMLVYYWQAHGTLYLELSPYHLFISVSGIVLCLLLAWGIGYWVSALFVWARDTRYIVRYTLPFLMFLTPVLYSRDHLHGTPRLLEDVNPLSSSVEMIKVGLLGAGSVALIPAIWSIGATLFVLLSGAWFMNRFAERILSEEDDMDMSE
jgi:lipopolysaccharide transport system permease protein